MLISYLWRYFICWYDIMFRIQNWEDNEHRKTKPVRASVCPTTLLKTGKRPLNRSSPLGDWRTRNRISRIAYLASEDISPCLTAIFNTFLWWLTGKLFELIMPSLSCYRIVLWHHKKISFSCVVYPAGLDQGPQAFVHHIHQVLRSRDVIKICLEPGYNCIHVCYRVWTLEAWKNSTDCIRKRGAGSLEIID